MITHLQNPLKNQILSVSTTASILLFFLQKGQFSFYTSQKYACHKKLIANVCKENNEEKILPCIIFFFIFCFDLLLLSAGLELRQGVVQYLIRVRNVAKEYVMQFQIRTLLMIICSRSRITRLMNIIRRVMGLLSVTSRLILMHYPRPSLCHMMRIIFTLWNMQ